MIKTQKQYVMKIVVNKVEGIATKKGAKQGRVFTVTPSTELSPGFYYGTSDTGKSFILWDVNKDWTCLGIIKRNANFRCSYTRDFIVQD